MKKVFLFFFSLFSLLSFAQNINDYEFVLVPKKFDFQNTENEYRLSTILKYRLEEFGFKTSFVSDQLNINYKDRCSYLTAYVTKESNLLLTKLYVEFKDCNNVTVFKSELGKSKTKDRKDAYPEALEDALRSVKALNYKFSGKKTAQIVEVMQDEKVLATSRTEVVNENALFAQPITNGFQLIDTTPQVLLKMHHTSQADYFIANAEGKNGVVFKKGNDWIFEYYMNDKLVSEKLLIKF